jgi:glycosyltransferase involved in cell wall biosynthesis
VSHRFLGRIAASALNGIQEETLINLADNYRPPHPLWIMKPYWKQVAIMEQRLNILRPLRKQIDLVLAPTQFTREKFLENGFSQSQVQFLPFGVEYDHPLTNVIHDPSPNRRFLFIGRLQPYKGAHLIIEAFNNLESPNGATLTLYGAAADGYEDYFNQLKAMIDSNERISFGGRIEPSELSGAFSQADYFVLPSTWHENSPLIILDALQSKTPVISSDIGGVTDLVQDDVNGLLFPMGEADALQKVMQRAIDQPNLLTKLRAGVDLPSIEDYAEKMLQLINGEK